MLQAGVQWLEYVVYDSPYDGVAFLRHEDARFRMFALLLFPFLVRSLYWEHFFLEGACKCCNHLLNLSLF